MPIPHPYTIFPLGDSALTIDFGNLIDRQVNEKVLRLFEHLKADKNNFILDLVPAYSSLTIYYDVYALHQVMPGQTAFETLALALEKITLPETAISGTGRKIRIPVCYDPLFGLDMEEMAQQKNTSIKEIITMHTSVTYHVYMIGFLPGFAYMGEVSERLAMPRRKEPRKIVEEGSVGIAGRQTGIYPLASPGGWNIIGRTPVKLFDGNKEQPVVLQPGDEINFYSITRDEFVHYQSRTT
jgi:inhibitor of KinA